jgi:hypothetical protein
MGLGLPWGCRRVSKGHLCRRSCITGWQQGAFETSQHYRVGSTATCRGRTAAVGMQDGKTGSDSTACLQDYLHGTGTWVSAGRLLCQHT